MSEIQNFIPISVNEGVKEIVVTWTKSPAFATILLMKTSSSPNPGCYKKKNKIIVL